MKIGADPELFMQDAAGAFHSSIGLIGGSKQQPRPLPIGDGYAVQEDNVAVEYNIPPASSRDELINSIKQTMVFLSAEVEQYALRFVNVSATNAFPAEQLAHPQAQEFGCEPDFNAWRGGKRNPRPKAVDHALRTCGGHVHIGHKFASRNDLVQFIKHMDLFLGVPSVLMDTGELRKELYGKAGAFRFKPYGGEYRSLSNFWVFDDKLTGWVWDATEQAMDAWQNNKIDIDSFGDDILTAINQNNKEVAASLCKQHNLLVL